MRGNICNVALGAAIAALCASPSLAQTDAAAQAPVLVQTAGGISTYSPDFFTPYAPVTALDMIARVPGFSLNGGDQGRRGLGDSFGNLLVNGQRPSNKSIGLGTVLQRIAAGDVERIELIEEPLPQYEMRGHARLANVIVREGAGNSGSYLARMVQSDSGRLGFVGDTSYTMVHGNTEITGGLLVETVGHRFLRNDITYGADGAAVERSSASDQRKWEVIDLSLTVQHDFTANDRLRVDLTGETWLWGFDETRRFEEPVNGAFEYVGTEVGTTDNNGRNYGISANYTRDHTDSITLTTIFLANREKWKDGPTDFSFFDANSGFDSSVLISAAGEYEETALRQTVAWDPNERHSLEVGAEIALNARDTTLDIFEFDGTTLSEVDLAISDTRVEEERAEVFGSHTWTINDRYSLDTGLRWEFSEITQSGDANQSRTFNYPKPSATLNYRLDDQNRLRFTARRDVDQLSFGKFASNIDVRDDTSVLGNPNYVPQRTWTLEGEWTRRFSNDGSFTLTVGHDWIEDLDDFIVVRSVDDNGTPADPSDDIVSFSDAPGNIGDGTNFRVTMELETPLDDFWLDNAVLDVFLEYYGTNVTDPLSGLDRPWSGFREWELRLDYRQNFPELQMAWGWDYFWLSDGEVYRATEFREVGNSDGDLDVYIETTRWFGATIRAGVDGVFDNGHDRRRTSFNGSRADGVVASVEDRNMKRGPTTYLQIRGTF